MLQLQLHHPAGKLAPSAGREPEWGAGRVHSALRSGGGRGRGQHGARGGASCAPQLQSDPAAAAGEMDLVQSHRDGLHQRGSGPRERAAAVPHGRGR